MENAQTPFAACRLPSRPPSAGVLAPLAALGRWARDCLLRSTAADAGRVTVTICRDGVRQVGTHGVPLPGPVGVGRDAAGSAVARIRAGRPLVVTCRTGTVWITIDGCAKDWVLWGGAHLVIQRGQDVMVSGAPHGCVEIAWAD
jgi:hypothetical protein